MPSPATRRCARGGERARARLRPTWPGGRAAAAAPRLPRRDGLDRPAPTTWPRTCGRWPAPAASSPASRSASSTRCRPTSTCTSARATGRLPAGARRLDEALGGSGPLAERMAAHRNADEIAPERLGECIDAFSSALRDRVRAEYPLPEPEPVDYEVVTDKPWSGFNYYLGDYRSTVAVNADLKQQMSNLPRLVAHESYPGHHTEHCRKEAGLVDRKGQAEQTIFLVNTPQCLMAEGLADLALDAASARAGGAGPPRSTPTSACGSTASAPRRCRTRRAALPVSARTPR